MTTDADVRDRRRQPGRRQGGRDAARRGLRRAARARRRRGRAPLRAPAALEGLPARRGRRETGLRARRGLLRRPRHRAAPRPHAVDLDAPTRELDARRRRAAALRPPAARHRRRAAAADHPGQRAGRRPVPAQRRRLRRAARAARPRRQLVVVVGAGWIGCRGRRVRAAARTRRHASSSPHRCRCSACSAPRSARSTATSTATTASRCCWAPAWSASRAATAVERVRTSDGRTIDCDFVVVGVGVQPRTALAVQAGIAVENGILVDERLQTGVAGRVRRRRRRQRAPPASTAERVRVEHWANALHQGPARRARTMLGRDDVYDRLPYFFSDQYDVGMEYSGHATGWDRVVLRGDPASREFIAFWLAERSRRGRDERQRVGRRRADPGAHRSRAAVDERRLADPDVPLTGCSPASERERVVNRLAASARRGRVDLAGHALAGAARERRVRRAGRRLRRHRRDLQPDDLRQGDHRIGSLRRAAARAGRRRCDDLQELFFAVALDDVRRAAAICCCPSIERTRGQRRLRLVRVHARRRRRRRGDDRAGARRCGGGSTCPNVLIKVPATQAGVARDRGR